MVVIDFLNDSYRLLLTIDCNSSEHRHSSVELRKVLPERFDFVDIIHSLDDVDVVLENCADDGEIGGVADIDECRDHICLIGSIRSEMKSINSLIHSFNLTLSDSAEPEPDNL